MVVKALVKGSVLLWARKSAGLKRSDVSEKINVLSITRVQEIFYSNTKKGILYFNIACTAIGLFTGIITVLVLLLINI